MGLIFKFRQAFPKILAFSCSKKGGIVDKNFILGVVPKTELLMFFL